MMNEWTRKLVADVELLAEPLLESEGVRLIDVEFGGGPGGGVLRVFIDKPNGVNVEDCATASRAIGPALDEHDVSFGRYFLEVSSPGAERKLRTRDDFKRFVGRKAQVRLREAFMGVNQIKGKIEGFCDDMLKLQPEEGSPMTIPFDVISSANLCL